MLRRTLPAVLAIAACLLLPACGTDTANTAASHTSSSTAARPTTSAPGTIQYTPYTPSSAPVVPPAPATLAPPAPAFDPTTAISAMCQVTAYGGTFWLSVTSAQEHNFLVCAGFPVQADDLDAIFASGPNVDRRCLNSNDNIAETGALVGVYSSGNSADLSAAQQFCSGNGWTNL